MPLAPVHLPPRADPWETLLPRMRECRQCALADGRGRVVVYRGPPHPWLLFVGEAPGRSEDEEGIPFVGRAGRILEEAATSSGLRATEWGVTNVIMCRPPKNQFDRHAALACRPWLGAKVASLAPTILVTLGANALEAFLPEKLPVSQAAGAPHAWEGRVLFPMLHPAATLHSKAFAQRWKKDWQRLGELLPSWRGPEDLEGEQTPISPPGSEGRGAVRALPPGRILPPAP